jgi:hypothetical protein
MGQYYLLCDETKEEYIDPWTAGSGSKLWELCMNDVTRLLPYLLAQGANGSGGDPRIPWRDFEGEDGSVDWEAHQAALDEAFPNCGRWAGDRIAVIGDYDESGLYQTARDSSEWTEVTPEIRDEVLDFLGDSGGSHGLYLGQQYSDDDTDTDATEVISQ